MAGKRTAPFTVFGFATTHAALSSESILKGEGIAVVPIPAPRSIGASCGIAMRVPRPEAGRALEILAEANLSPGAIIEIEDLVRGR